MNNETSDDESVNKIDEAEEIADPDINDGVGEDFDDFEAGSDNEDFGDFDEGFQQNPGLDEKFEELEPPTPPVQPFPPSISPFVSNFNATFGRTEPAHLIMMNKAI